MRTTPEMLRQLWAAEGHKREARGLRPWSQRTFCQHMGWNASTLAKWMSPDTPNNRRIPLERIEELAGAWQLSAIETDRLMAARLREMSEASPVLRMALRWTAKRVQAAEARKHRLELDECLVLAAYQTALEQFPRGLYGDREEAGLIVAQMQVLLERAEELHSDEARGAADEVGVAEPRKQAALARLREKLLAAREAQAAEARRRARES